MKQLDSAKFVANHWNLMYSTLDITQKRLVCPAFGHYSPDLTYPQLSFGHTHTTDQYFINQGVNIISRTIFIRTDRTYEFKDLYNTGSRLTEGTFLGRIIKS